MKGIFKYIASLLGMNNTTMVNTKTGASASGFERESQPLISVVMASHLGEYEGRSSEPERKFVRAVRSYIRQATPFTELVIVADGCQKTEILYNEYFSGRDDIRLVYMGKQELFSGRVRNKGVESARGTFICYLDSDDMLGDGHLNSLASVLSKADARDTSQWFYYNDYVINPEAVIDGKNGRGKAFDTIPRIVTLEHGIIGTSSIVHHRLSRVKWLGCDGYGHDWEFIRKMIDRRNAPKKIMGANYIVCHVPNFVDF